MGLSIVFSIIEEHNGKIELISEVSKGTEFIITLPLIGENENIESTNNSTNNG